MVIKCCVLVLLASLVLVSACKNREVNMSSSQIQEVDILSREYNFHIIEIDGCHYLILEIDRNNPHEGFGFFAHRGNCPNPVHYATSEAKIALQKYPPKDTSALIGRPIRHSKP